MCSEWHWHEEFLFSYLFSLLLTTRLRGSFERAILFVVLFFLYLFSLFSLLLTTRLRGSIERAIS